MKKYDKIWVPDNLGTYEIKDMDLTFPETNASYLENKIVLTIAELKEAYNEGMYQGQEWAKYMSGETFEDFIKEKGINIQP